MSVILRSRMFYDCDSELERDLNWDNTCLIYTRDTDKWWKIDGAAYVEVLRSNTSAPATASSYNGDPLTITQNANYRFVSDAEKLTWSNKQASLGFTPVNTNDARLSDARTPLVHNQAASTITDFQAAVSANADVIAMKTIIGDGVTDGDTVVDTLAEMLAVFSTYSEGVDIATQLAGKAQLSHNHIASNITDFNTSALSAAPAETVTTVGNLINTATAKAGPVDTDFIGLMDSAASNIMKKLSWLNIKATLKTYFDTLYLPSTNPNIGVATGTSLATTGAITSSGAGIGYTTGAGGTVTQATSRTTSVTLNKLCGNITMFSAAQAAQAIVTFTLTNSFIAANDFLLIKHISATNGGAWNFSCVCGAGSATITIRNLSTVSITEATPLRFTLIKGVIA